MKVRLWLLFLVFYVSSGYAIGQERTTFTVEKFVDASTGNEVQVQEGPSQFFSDFPNYRQAKPKTRSTVYFSRPEAVIFHVSVAAYRTFTPQPIAYLSLFDLDRIFSRPPPFPF